MVWMGKSKKLGEIEKRKKGRENAKSLAENRRVLTELKNLESRLGASLIEDATMKRYLNRLRKEGSGL